jgi:hypothetical protein
MPNVLQQWNEHMAEREEGDKRLDKEDGTKPTNNYEELGSGRTDKWWRPK